MSRFEFMRHLPVGQFLPLDSEIHRMDPRARLTAAGLILLALTFARGLVGLLVGLAFILWAIGLARVSLKYALRGFVGPLPFILILAVFQVLWNGSPDIEMVFLSWNGLILSLGDLKYGAALLIRFTGLVLGLSLVSYTTSTSQLTQGLNGLLRPVRALGIQVDDFVMMVQITARYLPLLAHTAERIAKAQASRGADWDERQVSILNRIRRIIPIILPLFLSSLHKASNMAMAMDARAYGAAARTTQVELKLQPRDWIALISAGLVTVLILIF